ncbi:MAG: hypothetical protein ACTSR8_10415 [Promethearchaeota archaeon]
MIKVFIIKSIPDEGGRDGKDTTPEEDLPWWLRAVLTGAISASVGLFIRQTYSSRKKSKEILERMAMNMERVENLEQFLEENLPPEDWDKFKDAWLLYNIRIKKLRKKIFLKKERIPLEINF